MKNIQVGELSLSTRILGTDYFGTNVPRDAAFALMDAYYAGGGRTLDTARMYAGWLPGGDGASEKTIGAWFRSSGLRKEITLITKGGHGDKSDNGVGHLHRADLCRHMSESLENLGVAPDLYLLHRDDPSVEICEIMETLGEFVRKGCTRAVGVSNWRPGRIREAMAYAAAHGLPPIACSEIQWSLAYSDPVMQGDASIVCMDREGDAFYRETGMPVLSFSSQAKGFFARGASGAPQNAKATDRFDCPLNRGRLARVIELARQKQVSVTAVVLAYITSAPFPAAALIGCKSPEQVADSLAFCDFTLTQEERAYLAGPELFPAKA